MIILKFGGTSVSTKKTIQTIRQIVTEQKNNKPVVIVSALKGITDSLLLLLVLPSSHEENLLNEIKNVHIALIRELWPLGKDKNTHEFYITKIIKKISLLLKTSDKSDLEFQDKVVSYGEIMSSYIVCQALQSCHRLSAQQIVASEIIITDNNFGNAKYYPTFTKNKMISKIMPLINSDIIPIITGFIGATRQGKITTLGRGGSDYSASIVGSCLGAKEIQIWTDVDGIYSADPRIVPNAKILKYMSYKLAEAFANSGAKVLCPKTIRPAIQNKIPIRVLNTFNPLGYGTSINSFEPIAKKTICGVTYKQLRRKQILVSIIGQNLKSKLLLREVNDFLSGLCKQKVSLHSSNNYSYLFLIESNNPVDIVNALNNKFIA